MDEIKRSEWYQRVSLEDAKIYIRSNLLSEARSFIASGYYLKHIRDNELYLEDGYKNISEFAYGEYGLSASATSRRMSINDRFSQGGNSPNIEDKFKDFRKSQLQEMLGLSDEQIEKVTPDTQVMQIREIKRGENIAPYTGSQVTGQIDISDFPEYMPGEALLSDLEHIDIQYAKAGTVSMEISIEDMIGDAPDEPVIDSVAISQPEPEPPQMGALTELEPETELEPKSKLKPEPETSSDSDTCPPYNSSCRRQEWGTDPEAQKRGREECKKCRQDAKKLQAVMESVEEPQEQAVKEPEPDEPAVIDAEYTEVPEPSKDEYTLDYFLDEQNQKLNEFLKVEGVPGIVLERQKYIVAALASMKVDLELEEFKKTYEPEQPELPILKNNDQRGAFVDAYETWSLWIETKETGERYYKYNLPDGTSMVVKVYHAKIFDHSMDIEKWEDRYREGYGRQEYYLLREGKFFKDCDVNRSYLIDTLKEIQRKDK